MNHIAAKKKPIMVDGVFYSKRYVEGLQEPLLAVRDVLLDQDKLNFALALSQVNVILQDYIEHVET